MWKSCFSGVDLSNESAVVVRLLTSPFGPELDAAARDASPEDKQRLNEIVDRFEEETRRRSDTRQRELREKAEKAEHRRRELARERAQLVHECAMLEVKILRARRPIVPQAPVARPRECHPRGLRRTTPTRARSPGRPSGDDDPEPGRHLAALPVLEIHLGLEDRPEFRIRASSYEQHRRLLVWLACDQARERVVEAIDAELRDLPGRLAA